MQVANLIFSILLLIAPSFVLWLIFRDHCSRWISSGVALAIVIIVRLYLGSWSSQFGGIGSGAWHIEIILGILNWAVAAAVIRIIYLAICRLSQFIKTSS